MEPFPLPVFVATTYRGLRTEGKPMTTTTYRVKTPDGTTPEVKTHAQARRDLHAAEVARAAIGATGPVFVQTVTRGPSACAPQCGCD